MQSTPSRAVAVFCRRTAVGAFVGGGLQAVTAVALGAAVLLLVGRMCGWFAAPRVWWAGLAVPIAAAAWWRMRRERMATDVAAAHLDRRLGLDGLLLSVTEGERLAAGSVDAVWQAQLERGLTHLPEVLPQVRWAKLLPAPMLAVMLAAVVALLPPPSGPSGPMALPAMQADLEHLAETMRGLFERGAVPDEVKQELQQKLEELQRKVAAGEAPEWRDLDQLDRRLEREQLLQAAREPGREPGGAGTPAEATRSATPTPGQLAAAAKALVDAGLLERMSGDLLAALKTAQRPDGSFDPAALPQDDASLKRLAEAMAGAAGKLGAAELGAGLAPQQLADLEKVLEQFRPEGGGQQPGPGQVGQGPGQGPGQGEQGGRGGVDRGPGHSALRMTEDAQGGAAAALPLPPGRALPGDWVPLGSTKSEPLVQPERNGAAGAAGAAGTAGASWQLDLAPRHRAVLRRFFGESNGEPGKEKR